MAGSPQSNLSGIGSWLSNGSPTGPSSQVLSPPTTPFGPQNDTWDLIYAATGQVARTNGVEGATKFSNHSQGLLGPPRSPSPSSRPCVKNTPGLCSNQSFNQFQHVRQNLVLNKPQGFAAWGKQQGQVPWSAYQQQQQQIQSRGRSITGYESGQCGHGMSLHHSATGTLGEQ